MDLVIRGQLRGLNDTPFGRPTPGRPIGHPGIGHPQGVCWCFQFVSISNVISRHGLPDRGTHPKYTTEVRIVEPLFIFAMAYLADITAELFHLSGRFHDQVDKVQKSYC
jgi:hypothetical protein